MDKELDFFFELVANSETLQEHLVILLKRNLPHILLNLDTKVSQPIINEIIGRMHRSVGNSTPQGELDLLNELFVNPTHQLVDYLRDTLANEADLLVSILKQASEESQLQAFNLLKFSKIYPSHAQYVSNLIEIIQNSEELTKIAVIKELGLGWGRYLEPDESAMESLVELMIGMFKDTELSVKLRDQCLIFLQNMGALGAEKISLSNILELIDLGNSLLTENVYSVCPQKLPGTYHEMALELFSESIAEARKTPSGFAQYISKYHSEAEVEKMLASVLKYDSSGSFIYQRMYSQIEDRFGKSSELILDKFPSPSFEHIGQAFLL